MDSPTFVSAGLVRLHRRAGWLALLLLLVLTAAISTGWLFGIESLRNLGGGSDSMRVNGALALFVWSLALAFALAAPNRRGVRIVTRFTGGAIVLSGLLTLAQDVVQVGFGIDELFVAAESGTHARPAPQAAVALTGLGTALALSTAGDRRRAAAADFTAVFAGTIGFLGLVGAVSGSQEMLAIGSATRFSVEAMIALLLAAFAFLMADPARPGSRMLAAKGPGGTTLRRVVPVAIVAPLAVGAAERFAIARGVDEEAAGWLGAVMLTAVFLAVIWRSALRLGLADYRRQASDERFETLVRSLRGDIVYSVSGDLVLTEIFGTGPGQLLSEDRGARVSDVFGEDCVAAHETACAGTATSFEVAVDGSCFQVRLSPLTNGQGAVGVARNITALKEAEKEARASSAQYRDLFENAVEAIFTTTAKGELLAANKAAATSLGYESVAALVQAHPNVAGFYVDPRDGSALLGRLIAGESNIRTEVALRRTDGSVICARLHIRGRYADDGMLEGLDGSMLDVTKEHEASREREQAVALLEERAAAEAALAEIARAAFQSSSTEQLADHCAQVMRRALNVTAVGVGRVVPEAGCVDYSGGAGWDARYMATGDTRAREGSTSCAALESNRPVVVDDWDGETRFELPPLGAAHQIRSTAMARIMTSDAPWGVIGIHSATARIFNGEEIQFLESVAHTLGLAIRYREAAEATRRTSETMQALMDNAPAVIYLTDRDGRVQMVNQGYRTLLGVRDEEVVGRTREEIPGLEADAAAHRANDLEVMRTGMPITVEETAPGRDGEHTFMSVKFALAGGEGVGGISTDITDLKRAQHEMERAWHEAVQRLSQAVEFRDEETGGHIERMASYCALIARKIGRSEDQCQMILEAAPMHDAGKVAIPDGILLKKGPLTDDEYDIMKTHAQVGYELMTGAEAPLLDLAATIAWTHHERYDGAGYPRGLSGDDIPLEGRIAAIADVFDALTSDRPYRPAFSVEKAIEMMREDRGTHFDPSLLDAFLDSLDDAIAIRNEHTAGDDAAAGRYGALALAP